MEKTDFKSCKINIIEWFFSNNGLNKWVKKTLKSTCLYIYIYKNLKLKSWKLDINVGEAKFL